MRYVTGVVPPLSGQSVHCESDLWGGNSKIWAKRDTFRGSYKGRILEVGSKMKTVTPTQFSLVPPLGPSAQNGVHKISCSSYCRHTPGNQGIILITIHTHMVRPIGLCVIMAQTFWPFVICAVPVSIPRQTLNFSSKILCEHRWMFFVCFKIFFSNHVTFKHRSLGIVK